MLQFTVLLFLGKRFKVSGLNSILNTAFNFLNFASLRRTAILDAEDLTGDAFFDSGMPLFNNIVSRTASVAQQSIAFFTRFQSLKF